MTTIASPALSSTALSSPALLTPEELAPASALIQRALAQIARDARRVVSAYREWNAELRRRARRNRHRVGARGWE